MKYSIEVAHVDMKVKGEPIKRKHPLIVLKNGNVSIVHPINEFIFRNWKYKKYNTQKNNAVVVTNYLNYLLSNKFKLRLGELKTQDLLLDHVSIYLSELGESGLSRNTLSQYNRTLTKLYDFYNEEGMLSLEVSQLVNKKKQEQSDYFEVSMANTRQKEILHEIKKEYVIPFLMVAEKVAPTIALGVYYQIMGGLRVGEVVNLTKESITYKGPFGKYGQLLDIRDRNLRTDIKDTNGSSSVKRERTQMVYPLGNMLDRLYKGHVEKYNRKETNALFVGENGMPMTGNTYRYYFDKLKRKFIEVLVTNSDPSIVMYGLYLQSTKWDTHIGRGTFSNLFSNIADNPLELARLRGDSSIESSLTYIENSDSMYRSVEEVLNKMYSDSINLV